jgi:hypothetical protein
VNLWIVVKNKIGGIVVFQKYSQKMENNAQVFETIQLN